MFRCDICKKVQKSGDPVIKVTVEKRERVYKNSYYNDEEKLVTKMTNGWEIVKEVDACRVCADNYLLATPA